MLLFSGSNYCRLFLLSWCTVFFSLIAIIAQVVFNIIWCIKGNEWNAPDTWWAQLVGLVRIQSLAWRSVVFFIIMQLAVALLAFFEVQGNSNDQDSCWSSFSSTVEQLGSHLRIACFLLLPAVQLIVGISHPSWISLPFFVCSCVGLVHWSLTSNFLGLFRWWRPLLIYACSVIFLFYTYQLPVKFPTLVLIVADFIGLYKMHLKLELPEICSSVSVLVFFFMLSSIRGFLEEMDSLITIEDNALAERLLPSRSGVRHANILLRGSILRIFSINFFTYGFPVGMIFL
ncbi:hypothetical protein AXF42_Ash000759 [Apostasia shenzhenica]|uniref:Piezo-type mechanosensitive ion channel like n=1 Tax=Apostasia shenzhenica TaxID=1088818 RepID=A0A2I0AH83_9ASPA|nr:hypothetical protein AXF42_Ash000759 [Apostasia shenzhenica]